MSERKVFLTGAGGDIGSAIRKLLERGGYKVVAPLHGELDLAKPETIDAYFAKSDLDFYGAVHCAGINFPKPFEDLSLQDVMETMQVNAVGFFLVMKYLAPSIKEREGSIVAVSSLYSEFSRKFRLPYAMSKHALNALVQTLALELGPHGVRVNAVSPGFVNTKLTRKNNSPERIKQFEDKIPLGKLAAPEDIAYAVHCLLSPENRYITGQNLIVDGGYCAGGFQE
ncbi:MAG: SDR family oxidoreductase [Elusimicrobiaceae bacterium]